MFSVVASCSPWDALRRKLFNADRRRTTAPWRLEHRRSLCVFVTALLDEFQCAVSSVDDRIFSLRLIDERPVSEVAQITGLTPKQVWYRQSRAVTTFRALFGDRIRDELDNADV